MHCCLTVSLQIGWQFTTFAPALLIPYMLLLTRCGVRCPHVWWGCAPAADATFCPRADTLWGPHLRGSQPSHPLMLTHPPPPPPPPPCHACSGVWVHLVGVFRRGASLEVRGMVEDGCVLLSFCEVHQECISLLTNSVSGACPPGRAV